MSDGPKDLRLGQTILRHKALGLTMRFKRVIETDGRYYYAGSIIDPGDSRFQKGAPFSDRPWTWEKDGDLKEDT